MAARTLATVGAMGLWLAAGACGSGKGRGLPIGGACLMVGACGGNIVGNWVVSTSCYQAQGPFASTCPEGTISTSTQNTGTLSFGADFTYTSDLTASTTSMIWVPATCLAREPGVTTCDQLAQVDGGGTPIPGITFQCTPSLKGGCDCNETLNAQELPATGIYETSGSTVTFNPTRPFETTFNFCAGLVQLDLLPLPTTPDGLTASGDIRFGRQ